jgi:hypothetical protein
LRLKHTHNTSQTGCLSKAFTAVFGITVIYYIVHCAALPSVHKTIGLGILWYLLALVLLLISFSFDSMTLACKLHDVDVHVTRSAQVAYSCAFLFPISICVVVLVVMSVLNVVRLRTSVQVSGVVASRVKVIYALVRRLKLYPLIFLAAFVPGVLYILMYVAVGRRNAVLQVLTALGVSSTGSIFALSYFAQYYSITAKSGGSDASGEAKRLQQMSHSGMWAEDSNVDNVRSSEMDGDSVSRSESVASSTVSATMFA